MTRRFSAESPDEGSSNISQQDHGINCYQIRWKRICPLVTMRLVLLCILLPLFSCRKSPQPQSKSFNHRKSFAKAHPHNSFRVHHDICAMRLGLLNLLPENALQRDCVGRKLADTFSELFNRHLLFVELEAEQ